MRRSDRGSALVIVLIISVIGIALTLFTIRVSRNVLYSTRMLMDKLQAKLEADSTIEIVKFYVATGRFRPETVSNPLLPLKVPMELYLDGRSIKIDKRNRIALRDTGGEFNVWALNPNAVAAFLREQGVDAQKAVIIRDSLYDWYDKNDLKHLNGAESYYYRYVIGASYQPRNFAGIQSIDELSLVRGLNDEAIFKKLRPYLTLSYKWMPNFNTMSPSVLSATLDIPIGMAQALVNLRKIKGYLKLEDVERITHANIDPDNVRLFPTFTLDIEATSRFNTAREKIRCEICFVHDKQKPYRVMKWVD